MKPRELRWLFIAVLAVLMIVDYVSEPITVGVSAEWRNERYQFAGGTSLLGLVLSLLIIGLYILLMYGAVTNLGHALPGVFRRFVAFWIDFWIAISALAPILGILPVLIEWKRTGVFEWSFVRATPAKGDWLIATLGVVLAAVALLLYYSLPLIRQRPSPGSCIVGYQVVPDEDTTLSLRTALLRTLLGFVAAASAYLAPFVGRDRKHGKFWLDKVFRTHAVKIS